MEKVKKFLESYVQWLAMALGLAFLGYTVYFYILKKPVSVANVGSSSDVSPAEVDPLVWNGPGQALQNQLNDKTVAAIPQPSPDLGPSAGNAFLPHPDNKTIVTHFQTPWTPIGPVPEVESETTASNTPHGKVLVEVLPSLPPITDIKSAYGHSNVPAPQPMATGATASPVSTVQAVDKNWETIEGTIPVSLISKSFDDAKIPPSFKMTCVLRVELVREEKKGDGTWSAPTTMPSLEINQLKDLPDNKSKPTDQSDYRAGRRPTFPSSANRRFTRCCKATPGMSPGRPIRTRPTIR